MKLTKLITELALLELGPDIDGDGFELSPIIVLSVTHEDTAVTGPAESEPEPSRSRNLPELVDGTQLTVFTFTSHIIDIDTHTL